MDQLAIEYSGMNLGALALWLLIATFVGFAARKAVRGKSIFSLWGDAAFGILGVFLIGTLMKAFNVSLTGWIASFDLGPLNDITRWIDIALIAFIGALIIRGILRPITGKG